MRLTLLQVLACPGCRSALECAASERSEGSDIWSGTLRCSACGKEFPIVKGIPRFVAPENYAESFGLQWNRFKLEQLDSANHTRLSQDRFYSETGWAPDWLAGKWLLEAGCGAGRFLEVVSRTSQANIVGMDLSNAVDAAQATLGDRSRVHLVQASIYEPPFRSGCFDACYCIGVIQHTPDPARSIRSLPPVLKPGGKLALTIYERRRWTMLYSKYWARRITRFLSPRALYRLVRWSMPLLFPLTEVLFRLPLLGKLCKFVIPVANYVDNQSLTVRQRYQWALLDTYDMLAPAYDQPMTEPEVSAALSGTGIQNVRRLPNSGVNVVGEKMPAIETVQA